MYKIFGKLSVFLVFGILLIGLIMVYEFYYCLVGFGVFNLEDV